MDRREGKKAGLFGELSCCETGDKVLSLVSIAPTQPTKAELSRMEGRERVWNFWLLWPLR